MSVLKRFNGTSWEKMGGANPNPTANDVSYSESLTYDSGTVGEAVKNLQALEDYDSAVVVGTFNGSNLYRRIYKFSSVTLTKGSSVTLSSSFISYDKIVKLNATAVFISDVTHALSTGLYFYVAIQGTNLVAYQNYTSYNTANVFVEVYYTD